jgi:purine-binding chemotaxis protein CheW
MNSLYLIARLAGQQVAIAAGDIQSVVEIEGLTPVPRAPRHVAGLAALRSRVLTVIDSYAALDLCARPVTAVTQAIVVVIEGHLYGLLVDDVEDVVELAGEVEPIRGSMADGWHRAARGMIDNRGHAVLVLDAGALVDGPAALVA